MLDKMKQIFQLQAKLKQIKQELAALTVESQTNDGKIKVIMNGEQEIKDIQIDDSLIVTPDKKQFQKDLINCLNSAIKQSQKMAAEKAKSIAGFDLPGL